MAMGRNLEFCVITGQYFLLPNWIKEEKGVEVDGRSQNRHKLSRNSSGNLSKKVVSLKKNYKFERKSKFRK